MWRKYPPEVRFMRKVRKGKNPDDCWIWQGTLNGNNYGQFTWTTGRSMHAHRASYMLFVDPNITREQLVCHRCDVPRCVNPAHMFIGSHLDNMLDAVAKGRKHWLTEEQRAEALRLRSEGVSYHKIAARYGVSHTAIQKLVKRSTAEFLQ